MFRHFAGYAGDPILSLQQTYAQDSRRDRVNLSIGLYYDDEGRVPVLQSVCLAQERLCPPVTPACAGTAAELDRPRLDTGRCSG